LHLYRRVPRRTLRTARAIFQPSLALLPIPPQPLVADPRLDPVPPTQLPLVRALPHRQLHKLEPQRHGTPFHPRHRSIPPRDFTCLENVFTMSPNTRSPCPRSIQPAPARGAGVHPSPSKHPVFICDCPAPKGERAQPINPP